MRKIIDWLKSDQGILRGAVVLGSGAAIGQIIIVASTPIISRIYTPSQIGLFALYLSFVTVAVSIAPLGFLRAIPSTKSQIEAATIAAGVLYLQPVTCTILALANLGMIISDTLGFGNLPKYTALFSGFSVFANTLLLTFQFWFIRAESYPIISRVQVLQRAARAGLQIIFGISGFGLSGLIIGDFSGRLLGISGMIRQAKKEFEDTLKNLQPQQVIEVFKKYRKFLFPQLPSIVINTTARMLPIPLFVHYFGTDVAGMYAIVDRVMQVPVAFISKSLGDALHGRIGNYSRTNPNLIMNIFLKTSGGLLIAGIFPTIAVIIWGEQAFTYFLGKQWAQAGSLAQILAPLALATLIVSTSSRVVYIFQAFATVFWYNLLSLIIVVSVFIYGNSQSWDMIQTATWLSRLGVFAYAIYYFLIFLSVHRGLKKYQNGVGFLSSGPK